MLSHRADPLQKPRAALVLLIATVLDSRSSPHQDRHRRNRRGRNSLSDLSTTRWYSCDVGPCGLSGDGVAAASDGEPAKCIVPKPCIRPGLSYVRREDLQC